MVTHSSGSGRLFTGKLYRPLALSLQMWYHGGSLRKGVGPMEVCEKDEEQTEDRADLSLESKTSLSALIELLAEMRLS